MVRFLYPALLSWMWVGGAAIASSSQLVLPSESAAPGASLVIPVVFTAQASPVSGVQFDVSYDSSAIQLSATPGDAARSAEKSLRVADPGPNRKRFLVIGFNHNSIPDGTLVNLFVDVSAKAPDGAYVLEISNVCGTDTVGQTVNVVAGNPTVTVEGSANSGARLQVDGVLNAGSLVPGPVAPGELITLLGSGIGPASVQLPGGSVSRSVLAGTSVLFDGVPAPLLYASSGQINAVAPYEIFGKTFTHVEVTSQGQKIAAMAVPVAAASPSIFTVDSSGVGAGAILNQDMSVNSPFNPAAKGSAVALFTTGAGQTAPSGVNGQIAAAPLPKLLLPASVLIGGLDAKVLYAGAAPGLIAGATQVNAVVPAGAPSGPAVPIVLRIGTASSQTGVTVAIR